MSFMMPELSLIKAVTGKDLGKSLTPKPLRKIASDPLLGAITSPEGALAALRRDKRKTAAAPATSTMTDYASATVQPAVAVTRYVP